jgi:hypothetical protein
MSGFQYKCSLCLKKSKNFFRFAQCAECLDYFCAECAGTEVESVKLHLKKTADIPGLPQHIEKEGGLKLAGKPFSFHKLCCLGCYNQKLVDLHVIPGKVTAQAMEVEEKK